MAEQQPTRSKRSSPLPARRTKPPEIRRQELMDAAAALLAHRSLSEIGVSDITRRAGTAVGTFYRHFATKEEVVTALRVDSLTAVLDRARTVTLESIDRGVWGAIDAVIEEMVGFWFEQPERSLVALADLPSVGPALVEAEREMLNLLAAGIAEACRLGEARVSDPAIAASLILHGVIGLIYHALVEGVWDRRDVTDGVREMVTKYLSSET